ncbi:hypothetical protein M9H77_08279 [Catharanthus roseus]|uniref:Uncharacterized protein n=1 Tax=Catharanthus roseus TaxID=4058 RepID=A0ACC0BXA5_CATRO|nr:hypothetical protein M9H77_08279 [Catharanthus roseus]
MELSSTCESSNLDVMPCSFDTISSSCFFTSERDSRYASLFIISQVVNLDASKLQAFLNKAINNFPKELWHQHSAWIISHPTSMEDIDSIGVRESLSAIMCHKSVTIGSQIDEGTKSVLWIVSSSLSPKLMASVPMMISINISVAKLRASALYELLTLVTDGVLVEFESLTLTAFEVSLKVNLQASPKEPLLTWYPEVQIIPIAESPRGPPRSPRRGPKGLYEKSPPRSLKKSLPKSLQRGLPSPPRGRPSSPLA